MHSALLYVALFSMPAPVNAPPPPAAVVAFDTLVFETDELQQHAKRFHDLAEKTKQKDWLVEFYKDHRSGNGGPFLVGTWTTGKPQSGTIQKKSLPYRGIGISMQGKKVNGVERLSTLKVTGTSAPQLGWGARLEFYFEIDQSGKLQRRIYGWTSQIGELDHAIRFESSPYGNGMFLGGMRHVTARASGTSQDDYSFQAQLPSPEFATVLKAFYGTPEELRDFMLADIDALRKQSQEELKAKKGLTYYDTSQVRSDNPPRPEPPNPSGVLARPLPPAVEKDLAKQVESDLQRQEGLVQKNFREIHAAVQQALPLKEMVGELIE